MPEKKNAQGEKRTDLRVVKTHAAICEAFERLLETTEYTDITVSAIAREAKIGRKTFYAHYNSIDSLLREVAEEHIEKLVEEVRTEGHPGSTEEWIGQFTKTTLLALHESPYLNNNVMRCLTLRNILDMMRKPLARVCAEELTLRGIEKGPEFEYGLAVFVSGACAAFETWNTSNDGMSIEEVAELAAGMAMRGISGFLTYCDK